MTTRAVVVLSGGQDSATCLFLARRTYDKVHAVGVDYGQRHRAELDAAAKIAEIAEVPFTVLRLPALEQLKGGALTDHAQQVAATGGFGGLPTTFIPGRNLLFLTLAAAYAAQWAEREDPGSKRPVDVVTGVCETDFSGYPDCRRATMDALEHAITLGMDRPVRIVAPLMYVTKAETVKLALRLGPAMLGALALTVTCYHGKRPGCRDCPACALRARGFAEAGVEDPAYELPEGLELK